MRYPVPERISPKPFGRYIPKSELDALGAESEPVVPPASANPVAV